MLTRISRPAVTKSLKRSLATFRTPGRKLHTFDGVERPEVVIGNNSILFSTISSLLVHNKQFRRNIHKDLRMIVPPHWTQFIHADYNDNFWGQTIDEIPQFVHELFKFLYPDQPSDVPITWQQYKTLSSYALTMLEQEFNVPIYQGIPVITKQNDGQYEFTVRNHQNHSTFTVGQKVFVYDWHRDFVIDNFISPDIMQTSHTVLYRLPRIDAPKTIIVLGDGESVIWLAAYLRKSGSIIYYLSRSKEKDPLALHTKPAHKNLKFDNAIKLPFFSDDRLLHYNDLQVAQQQSTTFPFASIVRYEDKIARINITGHFFTCIGMRPQNYTECLPADQVLRLNDEIHKKSFFSTKNIPSGGLMDSYLRIMEATENIGHAWEPSAILMGKGLLTSYMQQFLHKYGINDQHMSALPAYLHDMTGNKSQFSAMVKLYQEKISSDPSKVAIFEREIHALYEKTKNVLTPY